MPVNHVIQDLDATHTLQNQALANPFFPSILAYDRALTLPGSGTGGNRHECRPGFKSCHQDGDCDMMWMVSVQGIEIPVRARSRAALVGRLEEMLGDLMTKVSVSQTPVPDSGNLIATGDIRYFRPEFPTFLS